jgi:hypothetical protein
VLRRWLVLLALGGLAAGACSDASSETGPTASVTAPPRESTTTTEAPTPEEAVEAAYLRSWDVYAKAVRELDPSGLEESYAGDALATVRSEVERLTRNETPVRVSVNHRYFITMIKADLANVLDRYVNHSVFVDSNGRPTEPDPNKEITEHYTLKSIEGSWKVIDFARE